MAAILAADVVGHSKLMGEDEEGTHRRIKVLEHDVIAPSVRAPWRADREDDRGRVPD
jgi:class 3 adenylate cyclase